MEISSEPVALYMAWPAYKDVRIGVGSNIAIASRLTSAATIDASLFDMRKLEPERLPAIGHSEDTAASAFLAELGYLPGVVIHYNPGISS